MNHITDAARALATRWYYVFPVDQHKRPLTSNGFHAATCRISEVEKLFSGHPRAGVAIATGYSG